MVGNTRTAYVCWCRKVARQLSLVPRKWHATAGNSKFCCWGVRVGAVDTTAHRRPSLACGLVARFERQEWYMIEFEFSSGLVVPSTPCRLSLLSPENLLLLVVKGPRFLHSVPSPKGLRSLQMARRPLPCAALHCTLHSAALHSC